MSRVELQAALTPDVEHGGGDGPLWLWRGSRPAAWLLGVAAVLTVGYVVGWWSLGTDQADFAVYLRAASDVIHHRYLYGGATPTTQFTYPPFGAFLFVPLLVLPAHVAQLVWAIAMLAALIGLLRVTLDRLGEIGSSARYFPPVLLLLALVIWLEPVEHGFQLGQIDVLLALLCLHDLGPARLWRLPKGVLIGVAAAIKLTPLIFIPYLLLTRRWRAAGVAIATFAALGVLGLAAGSHQAVHYWRHLVGNPDRLGHVWSISNQSLTGAVDRWIGRAPGGVGWDALLAAIAVAGLAAAAATYSRAPLAADVVVGLTGVLISPVSWTHHFIWLVPALLVLFAWGRRRRGFLIFGAAVAAPLLLEWLYWVPNNARWRLHPALWESVVACSYTVIAVLVIGAVVVGGRGTADATRRAG